jgi:TonB family protein
MPKNLRFWRNVTLIGVAHAAVITGLIHWSRESKGAPAQSIVWMSGGGGEAPALATTSPARPDSRRTPQPITESTAETRNESPQEEAMLMAAKSEIQLPAATATPRSTSAPSPTPKIKVTPKPTPKPKPKPTAIPKPKPSPKKMVLAKAKPVRKTTPKREQPKSEQAEAVKVKERAAEDPSTKAEAAPKETAMRPAGIANESAAGAGGGHAGTGGAGESQFGWYGSMLHDRFYSEWAQPTSVTSGAKNSVLVKLRIEKDGRVSGFDIVRPSGNGELDQSVAAVAKRVTQVEPLPDGLGSGDHYDVKISFELNSE